MLTNQELTALLRNHGYKVTPQRLAVYEALAEKLEEINEDWEVEVFYGGQPLYPLLLAME